MLHPAVAVAVALVFASRQHVATDLRVEHTLSPIDVDVAQPLFSWKLTHPERGQAQLSWKLTIYLLPRGIVIWDSGSVLSNRTNCVYASDAPELTDDTDYMWRLLWNDTQGRQSAAANSTFSTALIHGNWHGAQWVSSARNGSLNLYRSTFTLPTQPTRARLYVAGLGYYHSSINSQPTDAHELGPQTTFPVRMLYDVWDVTLLLRAGCNTLGVAVGRGWASSSHHLQPVFRGGGVPWNRQFIALLSVTGADGDVIYFPSVVAGNSSLSSAAPTLQFAAGAGPISYDDIFDGEAFDGRVAAGLHGWDTCTPPTAVAKWEAAVKPVLSPADVGAILSAHTIHSVVLREHRVEGIDGITQPTAGIWVFDFKQNMAGIVILRVRNCPSGTLIRLRFGEIVWPNGTVHNQFPGGDRPGGMARMLVNYTCAGANAVEQYRTQFSSFGFQFVQMEGYPGVPTADTLTAHALGPDFEVSGKFSSSHAVLNAIQRSIVASAEANWANDVPTDCPHRERRGYLGDGQHAMGTVVSNFWAVRGYVKWLRDYRDQQQFVNATLGKRYDPKHPTLGFGRGRVGGVAPFNVAQEADTAWAAAVWLVPNFIAEYFEDERVVHAMYECARWQMEHWIAVANTTGGFFSFDVYGDFGNTNTPTDEYRSGKTQYFYATALKLTASFARRVGNVADDRRYSALAEAAREMYISRLYASSSGCFGNCTYVNQIFGLSMDFLPRGSVSASKAWSKVLDSIGPNATDPGRRNRFGGGITTLKLVYPLFQQFGEASLALRTLVHTDRSPSLGYMTVEGSSRTTLHEAYDMASAYAGTWVGSFNHIMLGSPGQWFYTLFAGIDRAPSAQEGGFRTWSRLVLAPPHGQDLWDQLKSCSGVLQTPVGRVEVSWEIGNHSNAGGVLFEMEVNVPVNARAKVTVPTVVQADSVDVFEGQMLVWRKGLFVPGVPGIDAGTSGPQSRTIDFFVGSGHFLFSVAGV